MVADVDVQGGLISPGPASARLTIDGDYTQDALSQLVIEIAGLAQGVDHDLLHITGNAVIGGEVVLRFLDGFAPGRGDSFEFLQVDGLLDIDEALFRIENLASGFAYDLTPYSGGPSLVALNDAIYQSPGSGAVPSPGTAVLFVLGWLLSYFLYGRRAPDEA